MIRVCHLSSAHYSGDARIFRLECVSLASNGYDTYLVIEGDRKEEQGVHVIGVGKKPDNRLKRMTLFSRKVYRTALSLDCDIYHIHDPELLPFALKLKKAGKKVIFDSHENTLDQMEEKEWIPQFLRRPLDKIYRKYAKGVFSRLDGLISVTPHIVDQLKKINPNTYMVTNYPILKHYPERKCKTEKTIALCFTGGIEPQWNHEQIIRAIGEIDGVTYNLCGWNVFDYVADLEKLPGWEKVNYYGKVSFSESEKIQLDSDVGLALLSPTRNTGGNIGTLGNTKLFEYMMAGMPLICTDFELWVDLVDKYQCGIYIPCNDVEKLRDAIVYLRDNPEIVAKMGNNGRRAVEEEFNWKTEEKILLEMYRDIINEDK